VSGQGPDTIELGPLLAKPADDPALLPLVELCVSETLDYFQRAEGRQPAQRLAIDHLAEALADERRLLFALSEQDGAAAGLLELVKDDPGPGEATVALLVLARRLRSRGLGTQVARAVFSRLGERGFACVRLGASRKNPRAARFWSSLAMWQQGEQDGVLLYELPL
jgi:ribosomal protein S18 acetylase RimI-like enzyme